ncbi:S-adenosyl-L-methionine-dependent methyltransferase [Fimicolochytrium jonesii]|uniref:S-adenosyl-L-methionine-dependent methyltransferase n=1 Tax=Fimicolochytrium jonesii TaxID=1396493 RepID=UPI0022FE16F9|nr:S-adenosyl-L-methionine-dependent methyltransferase [Fimicolochytrium jonesii]KAI8815974.1 S-adenosyl-L-methionine-dependent methyltransferase [Fimicolochytrium jonesii]
MQYHNGTDGVPSHLEEFHNGVHPRYVHFFRFALSTTNTLVRLPPDHDLAKLYPPFEQQFPVEQQDLTELWAGAGVAGVGFETAGFKKTRILENDPYALQTNIGNSSGHVEILHVPDAATLEKPYAGCDFSAVLKGVHMQTIVLPSQIGVVTTTFPCTHNSGANAYKDGEKSEIDRASLPSDISMKILNAFPAHYGLLENLPALETNQPRTFAAYQALLLRSKYQLRKFRCNAAEYGLPQDRPRVFLVYAPSCCTLPVEPIPTHITETSISALLEPPTIREAIGDVANDAVEDLYASPPQISEQARRLIPHIKRPGNINDLRGSRWVKSGEKLDSCKRPSWNVPGETFGTVMCSSKKGDAHPIHDRKLNLRERMRLQALPDNFIFYGPEREQYRQLGNGVPVAVTFAIAMEIRKAMSQDERRGVCWGG